MKAIILCGGQGTRLREQTEVRPKPMVEIGGYPILWHIMKLYSHFGITEFILCLGYKAGVIKEYFLNYRANKSDFTIHLGQGRIDFHSDEHGEQDWKVTLAFTGENAMTGCRVKRGAKYLNDDSTFCVTYGDGLADIDLAEMLKFHKRHGGLATLAGVRPPSRFGELQADGTRVVRFGEKPQVSQGAINGGFFFFERAFLDYLSDDDNCVLEREPLERCAADRQLFVYEHAGFWQCMDTYRDWERLDRQWQTGQAPWKVWP
jgi:glucose-1-phosphate cytidylyltransferase